jgi:hypothetical protein
MANLHGRHFYANTLKAHNYFSSQRRSEASRVWCMRFQNSFYWRFRFCGLWHCCLETLQWLSFENTIPLTPAYSRYSGKFRCVGDVSGDINTSASVSSIRVQERLYSDWVTLKIKAIRSSLPGNTVSHCTIMEDSAKPLSEFQMSHFSVLSYKETGSRSWQSA